MSGSPKELAEQIRWYAGREVAAGFEGEEEIVEHTVAAHEEEWEGPDLERVVRGAVADAIREQVAAQRGWPKVTDFDRLAAAFEGLERAGIVARHNFSCCQNCGFAEMGEELEQVAGARGFTFYHMQDTESAVEGHGLHLSYSDLEDSPASVKIGREVVEHLKKQGLKPEWDGKIEKRISVPMEWKRRWGGEERNG